MVHLTQVTLSNNATDEDSPIYGHVLDQIFASAELSALLNAAKEQASIKTLMAS